MEGTSPTPRRVRAALDGCEAVVNFAAEIPRRPFDRVAGRVHPDRRLRHLRAARGGPRGRGSAHLQISTDEVYGSIEDGSFTESSPIEPSSPYSASKAGGDMLVGAYHNTYGAEALIVRASNNYGPRQYPEKLIPCAS